MSEIQLLTQLVARLDINQMAIQAAIKEVALWIRQQGAQVVADNISGTLETLSLNADFIAQGVADLTVAIEVRGWQKKPEQSQSSLNGGRTRLDARGLPITHHWCSTL
ncbi:hypothetical protein [Pseudomonas eucalypticola]|uniref:Uncharacterized protein n=1 Tax=Pseudomonas eucalypticola TaxID=2599595 RepID=A0A7D5H658_9PSED|nr:hypothetical protein [Pseudomonas eucalypticola]QKZ04044.1 hypothetical protein HWQ56_09720 [Pseudomonas eucalypticola]